MQGSRSRATSHDATPQLVVIRSSDGAAFPLSSQFQQVDISRITTLEQFRTELLSPLLEIPNDCLILMNDEGIPLTKDDALLKLLREEESSGQSGENNQQRAREQGNGGERTLYVFDREHLDADPELVADTLRIEEEMVLNEPPLNPEDPLTSHLSLSFHNLSTLQALTSSIKNQRSSLSLALSNLHRVNTGTSTSFRLYLETANPMMDRFERLLTNWEENMNSIKKVRVVNGLLVRNTASTSASSVVGAHQREGSTSQASASKGGTGGGIEEKQRFLGDYVSREKMMAVRDGCAKILAELRMRTEALQVTLDQVMTNAEAVQADLEATSRDLEDLEACEHDAEQGHSRIEELVHAGESMTDSSLLAQCFEELSVCDAEHRDRIRFLVERKNAMTRYLLLQMQKISALQSDIASMPSDLGLLDHDLRTRTENFKHLARLEGLIPAYLATVAEVIRRKEYSRLLSTHSVSLSNLVKPLTELELSRRKHYRSNFSGKLPWEVRGLGSNLDDLVPEIGFSVDLRGVEGLPELDRETLDHLKTTFENLVRELPPEATQPDSSSQAERQQHPLASAKELLEQLISNVDQLSKDFESLATTADLTRLQPPIDPNRLESLEAQLRQLEETNEQLSRQLQSERSSHEEVVAKLENRCSGAEGAEKREKERAERVEKEKRESEMEGRQTRQELEKKRQELEDEQNRRVGMEKEVENMRSEVTSLREQVEYLEKDLTNAEADAYELRERLEEKEKALGALRSEADLDRTVLEKELGEVRKSLEGKERDIEHHEGRNRTLEEIAEGLREQIARWEMVAQSKEEDVESIKRELEEARRDKEKGIVDVQKDLVKAQKQARSAVIIAAKLRDENDTITRALNSPPPPKPDASTTELDRAVQPPSPAESYRTPAAVVPSLDYASCDIDELLRELEQVSHVPLTEAIRNKMDGMTTLTKKWVKEAKAYRERAHRAASGANDKIAFRHFAKGDLALFLPTRNSTVPVWAAFNVSFPHHFLSPTGVIGEQMKTREWIVARITSLSETIVDAKDPSTNPFLLAPGTKFFLLEVEPWSSKESSRSRKHSSDKGKSKTSSTTPIRPTRSSSERTPSSTTESAILVDRPPTTPSIRRTVSEGGYSQSSPGPVRSEYAIVEVEEPEEVEEGEPDSRPPSPPQSSNFRQSGSASASPSGLTRALARSQPPTPSQQKPDPFVPSSSPSNPFQISSSPVVGRPLRQAVSPPTTDYDPSHSTTGASPAFLPSASGSTLRKNTTSPSLSASTHSPRYIPSSSSTRKNSRALSITGSRPSPSNLLSSSPASSSANSIHGTSHPRSASSGSSILSSSMHRRGLSGISPSLIDGKALPTKEAQLNDSRWNLLQDGLVDEHSNASSSKAVPVVSGGGGARVSEQKTVESNRASPAGGLSSSASTSSVFDMLIGKNRLSPVERNQSSSSSSTASKGKKGSSSSSETAEGEIRKLLGQPQF
ncbi:uncharacterized protein JCM6883_003133 [Sporobolomyces salmoneus]|uniref:uncharacterized protein n=1 Tax=Sporobolomyces salmoneus TaxID=183962 RepID=UPI00317CA849